MLHMKTLHEGQRNHKCDSCGKSYARSSEDTHRQKNYKCESCEKLFSHLGNLNHHIKTVHENQKDYCCEFCEKLFSTAKELKGTSKQFIMVSRIKTVTFATNHFLQTII